MQKILLTTPAAILENPSLAGGKAVNLARLVTMGLKVPRFFCVTSACFDAFVEFHGLNSDAAPEDLVANIGRYDLPPEVVAAIAAALRRHNFASCDVAVRSSGLLEDGIDHSFAGMYASSLCVDGAAAVVDAVKAAWLSALSPRLAAYKRSKGLARGGYGIGVIVQEMLTPAASGVAFSRSPLSGQARDRLVIDAVYGLGEGLVSGDLTPDHYEVDRSTMAQVAKAGEETRYYRRAPKGGVEVASVDASRRGRQCLTPAQVSTVAAGCLQIEQALGRPQDVEWALVDGEIHYLQSRPITGMPPNAAFDDRIAGTRATLWDNSNIVESFSGLTQPLTFSHAVRSYKRVYQQFCRVMGVPAPTIQASDELFGNMLGIHRGRIYYNLMNWYRLLHLFPNAKRSAGFMETMMGVKEAMGDDAEAFFAAQGLPHRPGPVKMLWLATLTVYRWLFLGRIVKTFVARVEAVCDQAMATDFKAMPFDAQMQRYKQVCSDLLDNWEAPIINDCRCMLFFGMLKRLAETWLTSDGGAVNELLRGSSALVSAEPARVLVGVAARLRSGALFGDVWLRQVNPRDAMAELEAEPALMPLATEIREYLRLFGCRCADELKLEEADLHQDPSPMFSTLKTYLTNDQLVTAGAPDSSRSRQAILAPLSWVRRRVLAWVLGQAEAAIAERERLRLLRGRTFGVARRLFQGVGQNLARLGLLDLAADVFWLTVDELTDLAEGRALSLDLRAIVASRRQEYARFAAEPAPPSRFITRGPASFAAVHAALLQTAPAVPDSGDLGTLVGASCSPGIVHGEALVAQSFGEASAVNRQILVAERTDPGWVTLYPSCTALLVERGSLLSHSAVVARELGLPTIIGVAGLMRRVHSGQRLTVDAGAGRIDLRPPQVSGSASEAPLGHA